MAQCEALRDLRRPLICAEYLGIAYRVSQVRMQSLLQPIPADADMRLGLSMLGFGLWNWDFHAGPFFAHNVISCKRESAESNTYVFRVQTGT